MNKTSKANNKGQNHLFLPDKHVLFLCVDGLTDDVPYGRILNACFTDEVPFKGFGDMLLTIEQLCNRMNLVQSTVQMRHGSNQKDHLENKAEWNDVRRMEAPVGAADAPADAAFFQDADEGLHERTLVVCGRQRRAGNGKSEHAMDP